MRTREWSWDIIYQVWLKSASECGYAGDLFLDVTFDLPQWECRKEEIQWWPAGSTNNEKSKLIDFWTRLPLSRGKTDTLDLGRGPEHTLGLLWHHRKSAEHQAATLIAAFLFAYVGSIRSMFDHVDGFGFTFPQLNTLYRLALDKVCEYEDVREWHWGCTRVLPPFPELYPLRFDKVETLIAYIAERNALMLLSHQPVRITFNKACSIHDKYSELKKKPQ